MPIDNHIADMISFSTVPNMSSSSDTIVVKKTSLSVCCQKQNILSQRPISVLLTILPAAVNGPGSSNSHRIIDIIHCISYGFNEQRQQRHCYFYLANTSPQHQPRCV